MLSSNELLVSAGGDTLAVVFGGEQDTVQEIDGLSVKFVGRLSDDVALQLLYCSADVMVVPSLQENLSNTILESLSCGTPVVAFDIGGNPDMIEHKSNGYLSRPFSSEDLGEGILWVLNNVKYGQLAEAARRKTVEEFESTNVAGRYFNLYSSILSSNVSKA